MLAIHPQARTTPAVRREIAALQTDERERTTRGTGDRTSGAQIEIAFVARAVNHPSVDERPDRA